MPKKKYYDDEGELSDWAVKEIEERLKTPISECISHEEVLRRSKSEHRKPLHARHVAPKSAR